MSEGRVLKNKLEATQYLQRRGYKVSKSKVYADAKQGLIRTQDDGTILAEDLERYARAVNLQRPDLDGPDPLEVETIQKEKAELEKEDLQLRIQKRSFELQKEQGKYIPREQLELELASRAGVLDSGLRSKLKDRGKDLAYTVDGRPELVPDMVQAMMDILDEAMNEFARMDQFQVIFESDQEEDS